MPIKVLELPPLSETPVITNPPTEGEKPITFASLSSKVGSTPYRMRHLLESGMFTIITPSKEIDKTIVAEPDEEAIGYLTELMLPPLKKHVLPISAASAILRISEPDILELARSRRITMRQHPLFRFLFSVDSLELLVRAYYSARHPLRFDRAQLMQHFTALKGIPVRSPTHRISPDKLIEDEIARINHLDEPQRTIRATALFAAYLDARNVAHCLDIYATHIKWVGKARHHGQDVEYLDKLFESILDRRVLSASRSKIIKDKGLIRLGKNGPTVAIRHKPTALTSGSPLRGKERDEPSEPLR